MRNRCLCLNCVGALLLLLVGAALWPEDVSAQGFADQPDWMDRDGTTASGFPRFISIDRSSFADVRADAITRPQRNRPIGPTPLSGRPVDGTWQDNGGIVVVNLDGRQLRLRKTSASGDPAKTRDDSSLLIDHFVGESAATATASGAAVGRLMNRGRPLVHCRVSLIPLRRKGRGYTVDGNGKPRTTQTDEDGQYRFENVPPGPYKLFWLPAGQTRWIRRLEYKPDVHVGRYETSRIKTIGVALRTLN